MWERRWLCSLAFLLLAFLSGLGAATPPARDPSTGPPLQRSRSTPLKSRRVRPASVHPSAHRFPAPKHHSGRADCPGLQRRGKRAVVWRLTLQKLAPIRHGVLCVRASLCVMLACVFSSLVRLRMSMQASHSGTLMLFAHTSTLFKHYCKSCIQRGTHHPFGQHSLHSAGFALQARLQRGVWA